MTPLPRPVRLGAWAALILGATVGMGAAQGVGMLFELEALRAAPTPKMSPMFGDEKLLRDVTEAMTRTQAQALEDMQVSRGLILFALSMTSALTFVSALRLLRPAGVAREGVRRLLGGATLASAVLRTLDGAQLAAVSKRMGTSADRVFAASKSLPGEYPEGFAMILSVGATTFFTLVVVGAFLALSRHFRSSKVRELVLALDQAEPQEPPG